MIRLLIIAIVFHVGDCGSLVTIEHYNQPTGITYESGHVPIGLRAGPVSVSTNAAIQIPNNQQGTKSSTINANQRSSVNNQRYYQNVQSAPAYGQYHREVQNDDRQFLSAPRDGNYYAHQQSSSYGPSVPVSSVSVKIPAPKPTSRANENYSSVRYNNHQASLSEATVSSPAVSLHLYRGRSQPITTPAPKLKEREPLSTVYPVYVQAPPNTASQSSQNVPKSFINSHYAAGGSSVTIQDTNQHHPIVSPLKNSAEYTKASFRTISPVSARIIAPVQFSTKQVYTQAPGAEGLLPPYTSSSFEILPNSQAQAYTHDSYSNPLPANQVYIQHFNNIRFIVKFKYLLLN